VVADTSTAPEIEAAGGVDAVTRRLLVTIVRLGRAMKRAANAPTDDSGFYLLRIIDVSGPLRMTELAAMAGLDHSTVSRKVAALILEGHIERSPDPRDGRASRLALTPAGREAAAAWLADRARLLAGAVGAQQEADLERAIDVLDELAANLESDRRTEERA
jgi:DNA-binding MarR family transcriptional regulator